MRKILKKLVLLFTVATTILALSACSSQDNNNNNNSSENQETGYKDTVIWAQGADITSLDPHQGKETVAVQFTDQIFDTLTVVNAETG